MKILGEKRKGLWVLLILLILLIFYGVMRYNQPLEEKNEQNLFTINWLPYHEGLAKAAQEDKYILIDFYTDWCGYCEKMDRETYSQKEVIESLAKNFIAVKINSESENKILDEGKEITEKELALKYQVNSYPTIWFLDSKYNKIAPLPGFIPAKQFTWVLNYIGEEWYKKISFEEYLKNNNLE